LSVDVVLIESGVTVAVSSNLSAAAIQTQLTWMAEKDSRAKAAKPEQFIDGSILREIEKSGCCEAVPKISEASGLRLCLAYLAPKQPVSLRVSRKNFHETEHLKFSRR
jgi:hypothetical protein